MKKARNIIAAFFFFIFLSCTAYIFVYLKDGYDNRKQMEQLKEKVCTYIEGEFNTKEQISTMEETEVDYSLLGERELKTGEVATVSVSESESEEIIVKSILPKYQKLYEENTELSGWITIDDTVIDYPVMHIPEDNNFYLNHNFYKEKDRYGSLFLDKSCNVLLPSTNYIIYGHNMKDGSMFGDLMNYKEKSFYEQHNIIHFDTIYEVADYEIIAVFLSEVYNKNEDVFKYYQFTKVNNKDEFNEYIKNIKELSLYEIDITAVFGEQLLTLSTCEYSTENGRLAIVAKKLQ